MSVKASWHLEQRLRSPTDYILPTICQPIEEENVKIPIPDFFQHALR